MTDVEQPLRRYRGQAFGVVPVLVGVMVLVGWFLNVAALRRVLPNSATALALFAVSNIVVFSMLVWLTARSLSATDQGRISAQEDLAATERQLQAFLDMAPTAMFAKDLGGRFLLVNRQIETLFGIPQDQIVGRTTADFTASATAATMSVRDLEVIETGVATQHEESLEGLAGQVQIRDTVRFPLLSQDGRIYAIGGISTDVTEQRAAEAERDRLGVRLRQAERLDSLGQLAGGIAHDFNNLLGVILNYAEFVAEEVPEGQARDDVRAIRDAADRAAALTRQLLTFSRQEKVEVETLHVAEVVRSTEELLRRTLPANIEIGLHLDDELWPVLADRGQLEQILVNLVVNARDAMSGGGRLTIETANVDFDPSSASEHIGLAPGRYIRLAVSDTGEGMPESTRTRVFEPFFTTKTTGTGLGLATVYGIVKQAGGDVDIYSEPGRGTTVKIYLPVGEAAVPAMEDRARPAITAGQGQEILVVEDEDSLRTAIARILEHNGYDVALACSAEEALDIVRSGGASPRLLVTDVILPGRSGAQLVEDLRELGSELPTLFMSGYTGNALESLAIHNGTNHILEKPFGPEALLERVAQLVGALEPTTTKP